MELSVRIERWPLAGAFTISRGSKTEAVVVVAELTDGAHRGRGESVPYARYGETPDSIVAAIEAARPALRRGLNQLELQQIMPAGAARNALDCAYWDVNAKAAGRTNWRGLLHLRHGSLPIRFRWGRYPPWPGLQSRRRHGLC